MGKPKAHLLRPLFHAKGQQLAGTIGLAFLVIQPRCVDHRIPRRRRTPCATSTQETARTCTASGARGLHQAGRRERSDARPAWDRGRIVRWVLIGLRRQVLCGHLVRLQESFLHGVCGGGLQHGRRQGFFGRRCQIHCFCFGGFCRHGDFFDGTGRCRRLLDSHLASRPKPTANQDQQTCAGESQPPGRSTMPLHGWVLAVVVAVLQVRLWRNGRR